MLLFLVYIETSGNCTSGHSFLLNKPPMYVEILKRPLHILLSYLSAIRCFSVSEILFTDSSPGQKDRICAEVTYI